MASTSIGSYAGKLILDTSGWTQSLTRAEKEMDRFRVGIAKSASFTGKDAMDEMRTWMHAPGGGGGPANGKRLPSDIEAPKQTTLLAAIKDLLSGGVAAVAS